MLQATISRLHPLIGHSQILVVTGEELAKGEGYHLIEPFEKILEPVGRNTAPAIGVAALKWRLEGSDPIMVVLPADHLIQDIPEFHSALRIAIDAAHQGKLVAFGIFPTAPETGFGYIHTTDNGQLRKVEGFREKPDRQTAERFVASREYFWNSGMFVWRASAILEAIAQALPELKKALDEIAADSKANGFDHAMRRNFGATPSISIDHGVLEKTDNLYMVPGRFGWSDIGSWDAVHAVAQKDANGNAVQGNVLALGCRNSLIRSDKRFIAALGVTDITVVDTPDALLISGRGESQKVRQIVEELAKRSATEHVAHLTVARPWGTYTILEEGPGFKIKRIDVRPGGRLSFQSHKFRSEHWVVIAGAATVTRNEERYRVEKNESTFIPIGAKHRLENLELEPLQIIEVQVGARVDEDDIQRFDDVYGRADNDQRKSIADVK
jgi:mannose-1-phosphate guanylyltransferase/mannose-6-phosphate isomerase